MGAHPNCYTWYSRRWECYGYEIREDCVIYNIYAAVALLIMLLALGLGMEYNSAHDWQNKYNALQTSYQTAALKATQDAQAQEAKDKAAIQTQTDKAIQQAQSQALQARNQLTEYQKRLKADAGMKDLGHVCSGVEIQKDLLP